MIAANLHREKTDSHPLGLICRSDKDPELLSSATLTDFLILCPLAIGEFGHVDLVRVDLGLETTQLPLPCFRNVIYCSPPLSGAIKERRQVSLRHEGPQEEADPQRGPEGARSERGPHPDGDSLSIHSQVSGLQQLPHAGCL